MPKQPRRPASSLAFPAHLRKGDLLTTEWTGPVVDVLRALGLQFRHPLRAIRSGRNTVLTVDVEVDDWISFKAPAGGIPARTGTTPTITAGSADCYYYKLNPTGTLKLTTGTDTIKVWNDTAVGVTANAEGKARRGRDGRLWVWTEICP